MSLKVGTITLSDSGELSVGSGSGFVFPPTLPQITVSITPDTGILQVGSQQQYSATVVGAVSQAVTWDIAGGYPLYQFGGIDNTGLYTPPAIEIGPTLFYWPLLTVNGEVDHSKIELGLGPDSWHMVFDASGDTRAGTVTFQQASDHFSEGSFSCYVHGGGDVAYMGAYMYQIVDAVPLRGLTLSAAADIAHIGQDRNIGGPFPNGASTSLDISVDIDGTNVASATATAVNNGYNDFVTTTTSSFVVPNNAVELRVYLGRNRGIYGSAHTYWMDNVHLTDGPNEYLTNGNFESWTNVGYYEHIVNIRATSVEAPAASWTSPLTVYVGNGSPAGNPTPPTPPSGSTPATGLVIYNSSTQKLNVFNGTSWSSIGAPVGANTQVQFNNSGSFGGSPSLTFDGVSSFHVGDLADTVNTPELALYGNSKASSITMDPNTGILNMQSGAGCSVQLDNNSLNLGGAVPGTCVLRADGSAHFGGNSDPTTGLKIDTGGSIDMQGSIILGNSGNVPLENSALLQMESLSRGFLPPRMGTTYRNGIATPATGLQIFNIDTIQMEIYNGTAWVPMGGSGSPGGANTEIQFNNSGAFGASSNLTYDGTRLTINKDLLLTHTGGATALEERIPIGSVGVINFNNFDGNTTHAYILVDDPTEAATFSANGRLTLTSSGDNVSIKTNLAGPAYTWDFGSDGVLIPHGNIWIHKTGGAYFNMSDDTASSDYASLFYSTADTDRLTLQNLSNDGAITLITNNASPKSWNFQPNGTLILPDSGAIQTLGNTPLNLQTSAQIWVFGDDGSLTLPVIDDAARDAIASPQGGMLIYNTTTKKLNFYNESAWREVNDSAV